MQCMHTIKCYFKLYRIATEHRGAIFAWGDFVDYSADGEILFRWGRLCSNTESTGETSFQPRRESISGETLFRDTGVLSQSKIYFQQCMESEIADPRRRKSVVESKRDRF